MICSCGLLRVVSLIYIYIIYVSFLSSFQLQINNNVFNYVSMLTVAGQKASSQWKPLAFCHPEVS